MKTKFMKKMIALICAAAMTTSCATASVGAFKVPEGSSQNLVDGVTALNIRLNGCELDIKRVYDKLQKMFVTAEGEKYVGKDFEKNNERNSISHVSKYIFNLMNDYLVKYDKIEGQYYFQDLANKEIYDNDGVTEISKMLDILENHVKVLCDKIDGLSVNWEENRVTYTEKESEEDNNEINLKEDEEGNKEKKAKDKKGNKEGKLDYGKLQHWIKQDVFDVASDLNRIGKKAKEMADKRKKEKTNLINDFNNKGEEYNRICLKFTRLETVLNGNKLPLSKELQQELSKLTGRNDDDFTLSEDRIKEFKKNIENLRLANFQIEKVTNILKEYTKKLITIPEVNLRLRNNIRSIMNKYIEGLANPENINKGAEWKVSDEFKTIDRRKNRALLVLDLFLSLERFRGAKELNEFKNKCEYLNTVFDLSVKGPSCADWNQVMQMQSLMLKGTLNGLLKKCENI